MSATGPPHRPVPAAVDPLPGGTQGRVLPGWLRRLAAFCAAALLISVTIWLSTILLLRVALVTFSLAVALLLTALLAPLHQWLRRAGLPGAPAALITILVLLGLPVGTALLLYTRVSAQLSSVTAALSMGIDDVRARLTDGPLHLDDQQVERLRNTAVDYLQRAAPSPTSGATTLLRLLGAAIFVLFAVFFLLKDGGQMWRWPLRWLPRRQQPRVDGAGRRAWATLTSYVRGTVLIAVADAALIGAALLVLGVPLWLSLTLLTFLGAFVPLLGATVAGVAAVLVTLVTEGGRDAVIVLAVVLLVQQVEGNMLQPFVMGRAVSLHPLAILTAVSCGTLLLGIVGAVVAVPLVATSYQVVAYLARAADPRSGPDTAAPAAEPAVASGTRPRAEPTPVDKTPSGGAGTRGRP